MNNSLYLVLTTLLQKKKKSQKYSGDKGGRPFLKGIFVRTPEDHTSTVWSALDKFWNSNIVKPGEGGGREFSFINQAKVLILSYLREMNDSKVLQKCRVAANLLSGITFTSSGKY